MDMKKYLLLLAFTLPLLAQQTETDKEITKQEQRENRTATGVKEEGRQKKSWGNELGWDYKTPNGKNIMQLTIELIIKKVE